MDDCGHDSHVNRMDHFKGFHPQWNMIPHYQEKEENLMMNRKLMHMATERDTAISERDRALAEMKAALHEVDIACQQRDAAIADRETAIRERDNALAALHFHENITWNSNSHGTKRTHCEQIAPVLSEPLKSKRKKENSAPNKPLKTDSNRKVTTSDTPKAEMSEIKFDQLCVPIPVCTCTGEAHQCYKWGNMGWQSSCCTTTLSVYPLPQLPNKRHSRIGGRKMSGSVFSRLLMRVAEQGLDISSQPLDLKNYWAKHGTNRYITIK